MYPNRQQLLADLAAHQPFDAVEVAMLTEMTAFVADNERCFERSFEPGHVTASAWIVNRDRERALLAHHRSLDRWLQPGGHVDGGDETTLACALREAREETGLASVVPTSGAIFDVDIHVIPSLCDRPAHRHFDVRYQVIAEPHMPFACSDESHEARWLSLAELGAMDFDASVRRLVAKTLSGHGAPTGG